MTKLGIIGAMDIEVENLRNAMEQVEEKHRAGMKFYEGTLRGLPVVVARCGVGKVHAAMCVQVLADCFQVTHVVNTGIAGSLNADLDIADLVISVDAMYHDFDCCAFGYPRGRVPGTDVTAFPADDTLMAYAFAAAEQVNPGHNKMGRIASGDQFICDQAAKDQIIERTHALCTEMEGTAIAQTAFRNEIPFVIIRAISDKADNSAEMDYPSFEKLAAERCAQVTLGLVEALKAEEEN